MRKSLSLAVLPAFALLSACGGGGGSPSSVSTNPPPPPPPPPAGDPPNNANSSLLDLQKSETFTNDAVTASVSYPKSGGANLGTTGPSTLKIIYDAPTKTYKIDTGGRSQSFAPADVDASASTTDTAVYAKKNGSVTDTLTLTKAGTGGSLTYQYVGAGFWQRTTDGTGAVSVAFDAFTYGVETPDAALPRTGTATYDVSLTGLASQPAAIGLSGSGVLQTDFATGNINTSGSFYATTVADGKILTSGHFGGSAKISSAANLFSGTFGLDLLGDYRGTLQGRFYGPAAQEVGAAFTVSESGGGVATGTLIGRQDTFAQGANLTLTNLQNDQQLASYAGYASRLADATSGTIQNFSFDGYDILDFSYKAADKGYSIYRTGFGLTEFLPSDRVAGRSDARVTSYEKSVDGDTQRLTLYNPGSGNDQLALTYVSFGVWERDIKQPDFGSVNTRQAFFAFGIPTTLMPRSGTAHYDGILLGIASSFKDGNHTEYALGGKASFDTDFAKQNFTATLSPIGTDGAGSTRSFGDYTFSGTPLSAVTATGDRFTGELNGTFYGPNAEEIGGEFHIRDPKNGPAGDFVEMAGGFLGKKR